MLLLGIDTSHGVSVALLDGADVLARAEGADPRRHAETLAPAIAWVLSEAGASARDLDAVAVGTGPAPFTGLRVGLVTARTLARTLGIAAYGVCSLDALARQAFDALGARGPGEVVAVTDARRREVYAARYRRAVSAPDEDVDRLWEPSVGPAQELRARLDEVAGPAQVGSRESDRSGSGGDVATSSVALVGRGAELYREVLGRQASEPSTVDAAVLARLARHRASVGSDTDLEPRYLRRPDVSPAAARKRAS